VSESREDGKVQGGWKMVGVDDERLSCAD